MQPVGALTCHVVADYVPSSLYEETRNPMDSVSGEQPHSNASVLPLTRGQLVVVTAVSLDGMRLHGYVHGGAESGRAGVFPAGCVVQTLHEPILAIGRQTFAASDAAELSIAPGDEIIITAKCAAEECVPQNFPDRSSFLLKMSKNGKWQKRWGMLGEGRILYMSNEQALRPADFVPSQGGRGVIQLGGAKAWVGPEPGAEGVFHVLRSKGMTGFSVLTPSRLYRLAVASPAEAESWVKDITRTIAMLSGLTDDGEKGTPGFVVPDCPTPPSPPSETVWWYGYARSGSCRDKSGFFPSNCVRPPAQTPLVLHVAGAHALPIPSAVIESCDPTVRVTLLDAMGRLKGPLRYAQRRSQPKKNTIHPVWHCFRDFGPGSSNEAGCTTAAADDCILVEVFDRGIQTDSYSAGGPRAGLIGAFWLKVSELPLLPATCSLNTRAAAVLHNAVEKTCTSSDRLSIPLVPELHAPPCLQPFRLGASWHWSSQAHGNSTSSGTNDGGPSVTLQRIVLPQNGPVKKLKLIFIRHGESQWNAGQAATHAGVGKLMGGLWDMFKQTDHPLSETGVDQALKANRLWMKEQLKQNAKGRQSHGSHQKWVNAFMCAKRIYASPLTRALQTALLVLWRHPTLCNAGLTLLAALREVKNLGGQDTVGCAVGAGIQARAASELTKILGNSQASHVLSEHGPIVPFDASSDWWTKASNHDDRSIDLPPRQLDVLHVLRYHGAATMQDGDAVIATGHSLWFREFCARFSSKAAYATPKLNPDSAHLLSELGTKKLSNCGIAGYAIAGKLKRLSHPA